MDVVSGLSSVATAAVGGIISSSVITYVLGARRSEREVLRTKLESLYTELSRDMRHMHVHANKSADAVWEIENAKVLPDEISSKQESLDTQAELPFDKYLTVINIYFPSVVPAYEAFFKTYQRINAIEIGVRIAHLLPLEGNVSSQHQVIAQAVEDFAARATEVHIAMLHEADKINCPLWRRILLTKRQNPLW